MMKVMQGVIFSATITTITTTTVIIIAHHRRSQIIVTVVYYKIGDDAPATPTILLQTNTTSNNQLAAAMKIYYVEVTDIKRVIELKVEYLNHTIIATPRTSAEQLRADNVKLYEKLNIYKVMIVNNKGATHRRTSSRTICATIE